MAQIDFTKFNQQAESNNKVGTLESMLAGVGSGLIAIPKGFFSLGASLLDLGVNSGKAARVEAWFDDLTEFDEKAEATAAGKITELLVNIGIPGGVAFKGASGLAKTAMLASKNGKYVKLNNPKLVKAADEALELTAKGKGRQFMAGAIGGGVAEGVFVGDVEKTGSFGDLLGGPTAINRDDDNALTEVLNRVKFGTEGALFTGILGGTGTIIKKITNRNQMLDTANSSFDRLIDKFAQGFRSRSGLTPELFNLKRISGGFESQDINVAQNLSRSLELNIDALFPFFRNIGNKQTTVQRNNFLKEVNDVLLSGEAKISDELIDANGLNSRNAAFNKETARRGRTDFGPMDDIIYDNYKYVKVNKKGTRVPSTKFEEGSIKVPADNAKVIGGVNKVKETIRKFATSPEKAKEIEGQILGGLRTMRDKWSELFSKLGGSLDGPQITEFKSLFGKKFSSFLGSTYDIFQNQSIIPFFRYKPMAQQIEKTKQIFKDSYIEAEFLKVNPGVKITGEEGAKLIEQFKLANPLKVLEDLEAEQYVADIIKPGNVRLPKAMRMDKDSQAYFNIPDFFVGRTTLDLSNKTRVGGAKANIDQLIKSEDRKVFENLFGKQQNPMATMINGMGRLSAITRRNLLYKDIFAKNEEVIATWMKATDKRSVAQPMFARTEDEARLFFGADDYRAIAPVDEAQKLNISKTSGATTPFSGIGNTYYARNGVASAIEGTSFAKKDPGFLERLYGSLILYPKAASQIAKTILSPVTHLRNFVSAGAFAAANGVIPLADPAAIKQAYQALQTGLKGTRQQNEFYQELLALGVVNRNVRVGDLSRLLEDVDFGSTMTSDKGMRLLLRPLSKLKSIGQDLYTAEDDFWKIYTWAIEKNRIEAAFKSKGIIKNTNASIRRNGVDIKFDDQFLKEEAADIVKNNIPNYDYVSDFVKGLRKAPIGNFVSFPAEIARTGTNIVRRALREISETIEIVDGTGKIIQKIKPLQEIGYKRLFGFATTVAAVPVATTAAFQALYDVTDEERDAIRRYVAEWSKNSTILPIKQEDGSFKYVDFSHANAYDTLIRPIQAVINSVQDGRTDEDGIMDDFAKGLFTAMSEFAEPFISESIWTEAAADIIVRKGQTRNGFRVYSEQDTAGDKNRKIMQHLVKAQMPFSFNQLKRLDRSLKENRVFTKSKYDEYGQDFEFGDEFQGLFGFRPVDINPERALKYKSANYQRGSREAKSLFTRATLKGGPIEGREVVDAYINANRALFDVKKNLKLDIDAARTLNISDAGFSSATDRISNIELSAIDSNVFRPIRVSMEVRQAFAENAAKIGAANPYEDAASVIDQIQGELSSLSLDEAEMPFIENPLLPVVESNPITGANTIPNLGQVTQAQMSQSNNPNNYYSLTNDQKREKLFPND